MKKRIAVIGGGIAGLTAGYLLSRRHEITLFEKTSRIGGNAFTHRTPDGETPDIAVAAFGKAGYKNFFALLDQIGVETKPAWNTYASLHNLDTGDGIYMTPSWRGSMAQHFRHLRPKNFLTLTRLFAGLRRGRQLLAQGELEGLTMGQFLKEAPQLVGDSRLGLLCALCLLSSMEVPEILEAPADFFFRKLEVHNDVISPKALYFVQCVKGGTRAYVDALSWVFRERIVLNARIRAVSRGQSKTTLLMEDGRRLEFDAVVLACNPDQALSLLEAPTDQEVRLLGAWRYKEGRVVVHKDYAAFPPRDLIEAYTFLYTQKGGVLDVSVNGALWKQPLVSRDSLYISSQHPNFPIRKEMIDLDVILRTPIFDRASTATTMQLPRLNNVLNTFYCGSYFGYGLHEDAVTSAMAVANYF